MPPESAMCSLPTTLHLAPPVLPYTTLFRSQPRRDRPGRSAERPRFGYGVQHAASDRQRPGEGVHGVDQRDLQLMGGGVVRADRSEEHTSELQSRGHLVCRLLLEKKKSVQN